MSDIFLRGWEFLLLLLRQFAGGPGPPENNLARFGLPTVLWALLLYVAWTRQRTQALPREKLLVWGFGLGLARELFMFGATAIQIWNSAHAGSEPGMHQPLEHSLAMAAVVVVAGAFLRYILDDAVVSRRYLQFGLGVTAACLLIVSWFWPRHQAADPQILFHQTWEAWLFHLPLSFLILVAIVILGRERGWLRNVVITALSFFLLSELLILVNYATDRVYNQMICPIGNSLHILAIPLLAYVYLKEQSIEKQRAEASLAAYRDHLEELVEARTAELQLVNAQLNQEIGERKRAERAIAQRNERLAAQNTVAATLSRSLDLDVILNSALDILLSLLQMEMGFIYLKEPGQGSMKLRIHRGTVAQEVLQASMDEECLCWQISQRAAESEEVVILSADGLVDGPWSSCFPEAELQTLASIPLVSKGRPVGVMTLGSARAQAVQPTECELLTALGQQIGLAVENATLFHDAEHWAGELVRLHQASAGLTSALDTRQIFQEVVKQSAWLLHCPVALVCSWRTGQPSVEVVASHGLTAADERLLAGFSQLIPLLRDLSQRQGTLVIGDTGSERQSSAWWGEQGEMGSLICLPLWSHQTPGEFLLVVDRQAGRVWRPKEVELIENFANRAVVALINANLHQQLERTAALEERQRIAADMHDGLAQILSLLGLKVDRASELLGMADATAAEMELHEMREVVGRASDEARRSIASLQDPVQRRYSLQELLARLVRRFQADQGVGVAFADEIPEPLFVSLPQREQILPVVQEALLNAVRHARPAQIQLRLERCGQQAQIVVMDDGCGFAEAGPGHDRAGHFGLSIMRARAARMGGRLSIDSTPGEGTRVTLAWSLTEGGPPAAPLPAEALDEAERPLLAPEGG